MVREIQQRRGITLLFVISLIVLFLLMGATFVAISGNFMRTSRARSNLEVRGDSARTIIDRAFLDLVYGTTNASSPLRDQSILGDMYAPGFKGEILTAVSEAKGQLIRITLQPNMCSTDPSLLDKVGAFGGQVLTFISNSPTAIVKGVSCRIFHYDVQYDPAGMVIPGGRSFLIVPEKTNGLNPFETDGLGNLVNNFSGVQVLVNGRAFAGTGADPTEPYDAIDPANAFLTGVDFASGNPPVIYPSFSHFPTNPIYDAFRAFPSAAPVVDNDGDGQLDSIWIDPGFAVQTDSAGRQYKPLVAYMVLDLDGRFNLNLHGGGDDARGRIVGNLPLLGNPAIVPQGQGYGPSEISLGQLFPPPGGFPATPTNFNQEYYNILGDPANQYYGRFGDEGPGGIYGPGESEVRDAWSQYKLFGYPTGGIGNLFGSRMDVFGKYGWGFSNVVATIPAVPPVLPYGSSGDLPYGMPQVDATPPFDDLIDNAFETDMAGYPSAGSSFIPLIDPANASPQNDHLFSLKELERVYRTFDMDSKFLPNRLLTLAPTTLGDPANRLRVSTDSWEVPVPPKNSVAELYDAMTNPAGRSLISTMLSPDILAGLKMDINRPFGNGFDDNGNGVIDEYDLYGVGEVGSEQAPYPTGSVELDLSRNGVGVADNLLLARYQFAKQLYVLARIWLRGAGDFDADGVNIDTDPDDQGAVAQWSVNVVDFGDPDAMATPFEYDDNPFDGWECDGVLALAANPSGTYLADGPETHVVWGCERPELLVTESFATHDHRTEDLSDGGGTLASGDNDLDSRLIPVASMFIELYAPWVSGADTTYPPELYSADAVDLGRITPNLNPVWRIVVVRDRTYEHYDSLPKAPAPIDKRDIDPDDPNTGTLTSTDAYRHLYFIQPPAGYAADPVDTEVFYPTAGPILLLPVGQHAVVGSSGNLPVAAGQYVSTFGRRTTAMEGNILSFDFANTRSVTLDTGSAEVRSRDYDSVSSTMVTRTKTNVVIIPVDQPRSFNVSDPPGGYLVDPAEVPLDPLNPTFPPLAWFPVEDGLCYGAAGVPQTRDTPIDYERHLAAGTLPDFQAVRDDRTTPTYRVLHLQRLANPWTDWDPVLNPYLTVDSASVNLTAFNGVATPVYPPAIGDPADPTQPVEDSLDQNRDFAAMERGKAEKYPTPRDPVVTGPDDRRMLWPQERRLIRSLPAGIVPAKDDIGSPADLTQDLAGADQHFFSSTMYESLGTYNEAYFDAGILGSANPFTWLTWNNRPYVSNYELMLVPLYSSSQLLRRYTAKALNDPFDSGGSALVGNGFNHLPNFFYGERMVDLDGPLPAGPLPPIPLRIQIHKLLDFVEVPSRYVGTERYMAPNPFLGSASPQFEAVFGDLASPFNVVSRFRYPGKVNINTDLDSELWTGVLKEYAISVPASPPYLNYPVMDNSRRSSSTGEFLRPFREYSYIAPGKNPGNNEGLLRGNWTRGADFQWGFATVDDDGNGVTDDQSEAGFFGSDDNVSDALFDFAATSGQEPFNNSDRNAYFRFDPIQRLGNLATTRSNVFAIWITVGYFEVDPTTGNLVPGGQELGSDSGQIKRHRGFFIIDRSIPVGFEQGVNHNVERAVMVQSYIE